MEDDVFRTIKNPSKGIYKSKGSKFMAFGYPIRTEEEAKLKVKDLKKRFHNARHHCYSYKLGFDDLLYRINDDGEPSGTAGKPIYGRILSYGLTNILIVVVRYFGGTLLGTSGLTEAYRSAADDCIRNAVIIGCTIDVNFEIHFQYKQIDRVMRTIKEESLKIRSQEFHDICKMELSVRKKKYHRVAALFEEVRNLKLIVQ
ncbi:MAG: YigZ family protein [Bacteroidales bacterium]|nr:YigZ family protein [Bacteroidales bacterium]